MQGVLDYLEEPLRDGGDEIQELIAVSFLENLPTEGEPGDRMRAALGPALAAESERVHR